MFIIEILKDGVWEQFSNHTLEIDADRQIERMTAAGLPSENVRKK